MEISCKVLEGLITKTDKVLVGVSGGTDSMCLLSMLLKAKSQMGFQLLAVHINHNLRGQESERDENFVKKYCEKNDIKFICESVDVLKHAKKYGKTTEQAARELRYLAFEKIMQKEKATVLAVAHHKDDQAETVLMHIARGSSLKGATGMQIKSGNIIRPLLNFTRKDIEEYNKANKIPSIKDSSNDDVNYNRNYVRHKVIPVVEKAYPDVVNSLCKFASKCAVDEDFIQSQIPYKLIVSSEKTVKLLNEVDSLHLAIKTRLVKRAFEQLGAFFDIEEKHIFEVLNLFKMKNSSKISLPFKITAFKEYDGVVLTQNKPDLKNGYYEFKTGKTNIENFGAIEIKLLSDDEMPVFGDGNHYVDFESIPATAVWRTRQDGDMFSKIGSGSKKLNDYFTDKKIPLRLRDEIMVLASGNKVLVVAGYDISDSVKITSGTDKIAKISYSK
ncbi:MAG: tRNA lysidine(34) synthetase TilS [Clostridia bacterium]|nr:tRNA lysidine(34) synthetase TilS [Clostridia bacterium]